MEEAIVSFSEDTEIKQTTDDLSGMEDTEEINESEKYVCEECGKVFARNSYLQKHKLTHSLTRSYQCDHCPQLFMQKSHLKTHIVVHFKNKPFCCHICNRRFLQSSTLKSHVEKHYKPNKKNMTPEQRWSHRCHLCPRSYTRSVHLTRHMIVHTNVKPYGCHTCGRKFYTEADLKRHIGSHERLLLRGYREKILKCKTCGDTFTDFKSYRNHNISMHEAKYKQMKNAVSKPGSSKVGRKKKIKLQSNVNSNSTRDKKQNIVKLEENEMIRKAIKNEEDVKESYIIISDNKMDGQTDEKHFCCFVCDDLFNNWEPLYEHLKMLHSNDALFKVLERYARKITGRE